MPRPPGFRPAIVGALLMALTACADGAPEVAAPNTAPARSATAPAQPTTAPDQVRADAGTIYADGCVASLEDTEPPDPERCGYGDPDGDAVVLYGDAHAAQWFPAVEKAARRNGWWLLPVVKEACPPGDEPVHSPSLGREYTECAHWRRGALRLIEEVDPVLVLVASRAGHYRIVDEGGVRSATDSDEQLGAALGRDLTTLAAIGSQVSLIRDTPVPGFDVPGCIESRGPRACTYALDDARPDDAAQLAAAETAGATVVDLTDAVCRDRTACPTVIDGLITFRDGELLAAAFARSLADDLERGLLATPG